MQRSYHRVVEPGRPRFQLTKKGEQGASVFEAGEITPEELLASFRPGSELVVVTGEEIANKGLRVIKTPGSESLPIGLREAHREIRPGQDMTRRRFKRALRELEEDMGG